MHGLRHPGHFVTDICQSLELVALYCTTYHTTQLGYPLSQCIRVLHEDRSVIVHGWRHPGHSKWYFEHSVTGICQALELVALYCTTYPTIILLGYSLSQCIRVLHQDSSVIFHSRRHRRHSKVIFWTYCSWCLPVIGIGGLKLHHIPQLGYSLLQWCTILSFTGQ